MLRVSRIGRMQIELHRQIEGKIKTMTIKKNADKYYAIFTAISEVKIPEIRNTNPVGIDLGLNSFIALSDGTKIKKPKFMIEKKKKLARWQRIVARRKKGSKRREKAKLKLQIEWEKITNQSIDFAHKLSNALVNSGYTSFAIEKLNINEMVKNHTLAQSIYNASWKRFIQFLSYKAESAGMKVIEVDAKNTTKTCSRCGNIQDMPLSQRTYICNRCGLQIDRDINAAINILKKALSSSNFGNTVAKATSGQGGSNAQGDTGQYIPAGNASCVEELRTNKNFPLQNVATHNAKETHWP